MEFVMFAFALGYLCILLFLVSLAYRFVVAVERIAGSLNRWSEVSLEHKA